MRTFKIMIIVLLTFLVVPTFAQEQQDAAAKKALEIQKKIKVKIQQKEKF